MAVHSDPFPPLDRQPAVRGTSGGGKPRSFRSHRRSRRRRDRDTESRHGGRVIETDLARLGIVEPTRPYARPATGSPFKFTTRPVTSLSRPVLNADVLLAATGENRIGNHDGLAFCLACSISLETRSSSSVLNGVVRSESRTATACSSDPPKKVCKTRRSAPTAMRRPGTLPAGRRTPAPACDGRQTPCFRGSPGASAPPSASAGPECTEPPPATVASPFSQITSMICRSRLDNWAGSGICNSLRIVFAKTKILVFLGEVSSQNFGVSGQGRRTGAGRAFLTRQLAACRGHHGAIPGTA